MSAIAIKMAHRIPELVVRALAGDPSALAMLAFLGIGAGLEVLARKD